ncbi:MAG: FtsQ-type POTRA domain-containing protein [Actinomycetaceae bacterium]|nr:FtsQ-type POTRA domain-containing protein [Actinomycetaceae bacterium]
MERSQAAGQSYQHRPAASREDGNEKRYYPSTRASEVFGSSAREAEGKDVVASRYRTRPRNRGAQPAAQPERQLQVGEVEDTSPKSRWRKHKRKNSANELDLKRQQIKRANRWRIARYVGISLAVIATMVSLVAVAFLSPLFALDASKIRVSGTGQKVSQEQVLAALTPYHQVPLPRLDIASVRGQVEKITQVKSANVTRQWPRGIEVAITVRQPALAVPEGDQWKLLDAEAVELETAAQVPPGVMKADLNNAEDENRKRGVEMIVKVIDHVQPEFKELIDTVVSDGVTVQIRTVNGPVVKWGSPEESQFKSEVALILMQQRPAQVYDVSTPTRPVTS